jgi:LmbE family N-acetylglucosaminyl deacetylase
VVTEAAVYEAVRSLGTILGVWAHPDDEAYLSAGLMAMAAANGQRVVVVTATRGEYGTADPDRWPPRRLARLRRQELAAALKAVGVHEHRVLGYVDGRCSAVPISAGAAEVAGMIRAVRPDTIVTFGPDGMTGHPDHRAVSRWVSAAWERTGYGARVLHATKTPEFAARFEPLHSRLSIFDEGLPATTPVEDLALDLCPPPEILDRKHAALRAHRSQTLPLVQAMGAATYRAWCDTSESFAELERDSAWTRGEPVSIGLPTGR